jgi:L-lactate dehydrogenase complex protein LldG
MSSRDKILSTVKNNQPDHRELPPLPGDPGYTGPLPASGPALATTLPASAALPAAASAAGDPPPADLLHAFTSVLEAIGGNAYLVSGYDRIATILHEQYPEAKRIVTSCPELSSFAETAVYTGNPHSLENIDLAILQAHFGVAENGACWITEDRMVERALPFIAQNLALVIGCKDIVANMHEAYDRIAAIESAAPTASSAATAQQPASQTVSPAAASLSAGDAPPAIAPSYGFATFIAGPSKTADIEQSLVLGAHGPKSLTVFLLDEGISDAGFF